MILVQSVYKKEKDNELIVEALYLDLEDLKDSKFDGEKVGGGGGGEIPTPIKKSLLVTSVPTEPTRSYIQSKHISSKTITAKKHIHVKTGNLQFQKTNKQNKKQRSKRVKTKIV